MGFTYRGTVPELVKMGMARNGSGFLYDVMRHLDHDNMIRGSESGAIGEFT
jgi:hypothetical protein